MNPIASLFVAIEADLSGLKSGLGRAESMVVGAAKGVGLLALGAGVGVAALALPIINAGVEFNKMKETAFTAFSTILGDGARATKLMSELQEFAAKTPFEFGEIASAAKSLLAFGVGAEDVQKTLKSVGDIASGVGAPIGEIAELYGKAKVQGRLFAEDINQLTGRGIPIIQELAKQFGVNENEVKKLVESGQVGFPNLEKAFQSLTSEGGKFSGMMDAQSKTFSGMMSTLMDNFNQLAGELAAPIFDVLKEGLGGLLELMDTPAFKEGVKEFAQTIGGALKSGIEWLKGVLPQVQQGVTGAGNAFGVIQQAIGAVWRFVQPILQNIFDELAKFWTEIQPKLAAAWDNIQRVTSIVFGAIAKFIQDHWTEIRMVFEGAFSILQGIVQVAWSLISGIIKIALDLIAGDFDAAGRDFNQMMRGIWDGIQKIIQGAWTEIQGYARLALNTLGRTIWDKLVEIDNWIVGKFNDIVSWLQGLPAQFVTAGVNIMQGLIDGFWQKAADIQNTLNAIIQAAVDSLWQNLNPLGSPEIAAKLELSPTRPTTESALTRTGGLMSGGGNTFIVNFNGVNAPTTQGEAEQSANLFMNALRAKGMAV